MRLSRPLHKCPHFSFHSIPVIYYRLMLHYFSLLLSLIFHPFNFSYYLPAITSFLSLDLSILVWPERKPSLWYLFISSFSLCCTEWTAENKVIVTCNPGHSFWTVYFHLIFYVLYFDAEHSPEKIMIKSLIIVSSYLNGFF